MNMHTPTLIPKASRLHCWSTITRCKTPRLHERERPHPSKRKLGTEALNPGHINMTPSMITAIRTSIAAD